MALMLFCLLLKALCEAGISVGIDLGTTNSAVFVFTPDRDKPFNVAWDGQNSTMPSVVRYSFEKHNTEVKTSSVVGDKSTEKGGDLRNLVTSSKRMIGLSQKDIRTNKRLKDMYDKGAFNIAPLDPNKESSPMVIPLYFADNVVKRVHAVEVSAAILSRLMDAVHRSFGTAISSCIVTVPAYFNENQIESTKEAARIAALPLTRTLNEPVAAAFAYQMKYPDAKLPTTLVFDMGGGTLDISIVEYAEDVLEVVCYAGDNFLGGDDVDNALYAYFLKEFESQRFADEKTKLRLRHFAEDFKKALCSKQLQLDAEESTKGMEATHSEEFFYTIADTHTFTLSTSQFNKVIDPVMQRVRNCISSTAADGEANEGSIMHQYHKAGGSEKNIGTVLLVGGSTRLPAIRTMLREFFGNRVSDALDADTCVAEGACWYAAAFSGLANLPAHVDVVSVPIGICVGEDTFSPIVKMNATVPAVGSEIFTTSVDMQRKVVIRVGQGVRYAFKHAHYLGEFTLDIDNPAPRGVPKIEVTIRIDKDRTLTVVAKDMVTKKEANIVFTRSSHTLSSEEIDRMIAEREAKKEEDEKLRLKNEALSIYETYLSALRQRIATASQMPEQQKSTIYERLSKEEAWLKNEKETAEAKDFDEKYEALKGYIEPILAQYEQPTDKEQPRDTEKVREDL